MTSNFPPGERDRTALRIGIYVTVILIFFMFLGRFVLSFFGISVSVLMIAGGLIVANTAWGMVTASSRITAAESHGASTKEDISLTPMAVPILSGPGSIGVVMGLAADADSKVAYLRMVIAIGAIGLAVYLFLRLGCLQVERLGPCATGAINRIFGFLILAIAVQLVWNGATNSRRWMWRGRPFEKAAAGFRRQKSHRALKPADCGCRSVNRYLMGTRRTEMSAPMNYLDGNAAAGELSRMFAMDVTTAEGQCAHCGAIRRFAEAHLYMQAPGVVARCAVCKPCSFVL